MNITYEEKKVPAVISPITKDLFTFLENNKEYIGITLRLIFRVKCKVVNKNDIERRIGNFLSTFPEVKHSTKEEKLKLDAFIDKIFAFYSQEEDEVSHNRGYLLEEVASMLKLCPECIESDNYKCRREVLVYEDGQPISQKDLDVVFEHCQDDLLECKVGLKKYVQPLTDDHKEKLEFMKQAYDRLNLSGKKSSIYLVASSKEAVSIKRILTDLGYNDFEVIDADYIMSHI